MSIHDHQRHPWRDLHGLLIRPVVVVALILAAVGLAAGGLPLPPIGVMP